MKKRDLDYFKVDFVSKEEVLCNNYLVDEIVNIIKEKKVLYEKLIVKKDFIHFYCEKEIRHATLFFESEFDLMFVLNKLNLCK